ncbi:MAG: hypothetical protein ACRCTQ_04180 [Brevinemataceae bacterium]
MKKISSAVLLPLLFLLSTCSISPKEETLSPAEIDNFINDISRGFWKLHPNVFAQAHGQILQSVFGLNPTTSRVKILKAGDPISDLYLNNASFQVKPGDAIADSGIGKAFRVYMYPTKNGIAYTLSGNLIGGIFLSFYLPVLVTNNFEGTGEDRLYTGWLTDKPEKIIFDFEETPLAENPTRLVATRVAE